MLGIAEFPAAVHAMGVRNDQDEMPMKETFATTNARRQAEFRARRRAADFARLQAVAPGIAEAVAQCREVGLVVSGVSHLTEQLELELAR